MDDLLVEAFIHRTAPPRARARGLSGHVVLGRRLRPFCFWHAFLLDSIGSPFAGHPGQFNEDALVRAVDICTLRYPDGPSLGRLAWLRRIRMRWAHRRRWSEHFLAFLSYRADYESLPQFMQSEESEPIHTPFYLFAVARLVREGSLPLREAWMTPVGVGQWLSVAFIEASGRPLKNLITPELRETLRSLGHAI